MIGIVVAAHGKLTAALVDTARTVFSGGAEPIAVGIDPYDDTESYAQRLREAVARARGDAGVLVLTDMFGGTPSNVGLTLHAPGSVEVLTGVNLPMLIKALQLSTSGLPLSEAASKVKAAGQHAIAVASEVLAVPESATPTHLADEQNGSVEGGST